jgi:inner membrane protein YidH
MIRGYGDHAANERTFLAWLRTSIAVIAFGFVVEKFNLFVLTMPSATFLDETRRSQLKDWRDRLGEVLATPLLWWESFR